MANKKVTTDGRFLNGGRRKGAGRKPGLVPKALMRVSVPKKYKKEIKAKTIKLAKSYEEKALRELCPPRNKK